MYCVWAWGCVATWSMILEWFERNACINNYKLELAGSALKGPLSVMTLHIKPINYIGVCFTLLLTTL